MRRITLLDDRITFIIGDVTLSHTSEDLPLFNDIDLQTIVRIVLTATELKFSYQFLMPLVPLFHRAGADAGSDPELD